MDDSDDVSTLVVAARKGDSAAWSALVSRYARLVLSVLRSCGVHGADADDVSQVVWLRLVEHLDDLREPQALPGFIKRITRNEAFRLVKARALTEAHDPQAGGDVLDRPDVVDFDARLAREDRR